MNNYCYKCDKSLYLSDVESDKWYDDREEFILKCSYCGEENKIIIQLFIEGHINKYNLEMLKQDKNYLPEKQIEIIKNHLENCQICRDSIDELYLEEATSNVNFNQESLKYFDIHSKEINSEIFVESNGVKKFSYENQVYILKPEDEFYRENNKIYYYLKEDICLAGMVSIMEINNNFKLDKIWLRSKESLEKERNFFELLKDKKIKLELQTLETIFKRLR